MEKFSSRQIHTKMNFSPAGTFSFSPLTYVIFLMEMSSPP